MNAFPFDHVDHVARALATRLSRRDAVRSAGAGMLAAGGFGALAVARPGRAEDSADTPALSREESDKTEYLFVQTFDGGTWAPKEGGDGVFALTLTGHAAQTVYFSDRPERIVGAVPTIRFLDALGFTPANPPNAALVTRTDDGEDVLVLELFDPVYTEEFDDDGGVTVTYAARVLDDYTEDGLAHLAARQVDATLPASFGTASLFIDDCPDLSTCHHYDVERGDIIAGPLPNSPDGSPWGRCWSWSDVQCIPCSHPWQFYYDLCNQAYPDVCHGHCTCN